MPQFKSAEALLNFCVQQEAIQVANEAVRALTRNTPKDTTLASESWTANLGQHNPVAITVPDDRFARRALATTRRARKELSLLGIRGFNARTHRKISITNDVPYIDRLEAGHSTQAPDGFIQRSCLEAVSRSRRR